MLSIEKRIHSVVVIGEFAMSRFLKDSFVDISRFDESEIDTVFYKKDLIAYRLSDSYRIDVQRHRLTFQALKDMHQEFLDDLVEELMLAVASSPITAIGVNCVLECKTSDIASFNKLGHVLAPKIETWEKFMKNTGMENIHVSGSRVDDANSGMTHIIIKPTSIDAFTVSITINDHYDFVPKDSEILESWKSIKNVFQEARENSISRSSSKQNDMIKVFNDAIN